MEIPINLVVEDVLSEVVIRKLLENSQVNFVVGLCYGKQGYGYIKKNIRVFNYTAKGMPQMVLSDLEDECSPSQISNWLHGPSHPNLIFRIAVMEIESWILADRKSIAYCVGKSQKHIPANTDEIADPKECLINLARKSRRRLLRESLTPRPNSTAKVGPDYNGQMSIFALKFWNANAAAKNSDSLRRCIEAIEEFTPEWPHT